MLIFLDDDIYLTTGQLKRAVADHCSHPTIWFVARIVALPEHLLTPFGRFRLAVSSVSLPAESFQEVETFASGFAVVPRNSILEIGGYNED